MKRHARRSNSFSESHHFALNPRSLGARERHFGGYLALGDLSHVVGPGNTCRSGKYQDHPKYDFTCRLHALPNRSLSCAPLPVAFMLSLTVRSIAQRCSFAKVKLAARAAGSKQVT